MNFSPCMCGDTECWSCGSAQGTHTEKRQSNRVTFVYLVMTDGKESVMQIARGNVTKRNTINLNAKTTVDVATVKVQAGLQGIHWQLANEYSTPDAPAWEGCKV